MLVVANLSRSPQFVKLDLSAYKNHVPLELLGNGSREWIDRRGADHLELLPGSAASPLPAGFIASACRENGKRRTQNQCSFHIRFLASELDYLGN